jgi:type II secretory pathway pseudopilin PulG
LIIFPKSRIAARLSPESYGRGAFTLLQLIGVLSVMAILASVIIPVGIKRMDQAARDAEETSLAAMAEALVQSSLKSRTIPAANTASSVIAAYLNEPTNKTSLNKRGLARVFLADPNASINGFGLSSPYVQSYIGSSYRPLGVRFLILSTVAVGLPAINSTNFDNIWNTAKGTVPTSLSSWGGRGEDLLVERVELGPYFRKVLLMNVDPPPATGIYSIDNATTNGLTGNTPFVAYYLEGTVLNVYRPNGAIDFREVIKEDFSLVYQNEKWRHELGSGGGDSGDFGQLVDRFLQGPCPCDPENGGNQRAVVNAFYDYLWGYADWAFGDTSASPIIPPFAGAGLQTTVQYPSYTVVYNAAGYLSGSADSFTENLIK